MNIPQWLCRRGAALLATALVNFSGALTAGANSAAAAFSEANAIIVSTNFETGSAGKVEWLNPTELRVHVAGQANESGRNRQATWYFFRLDGTRSRQVTVHLTDLVGEYNNRPGAVAMNADTIPVFSLDGTHWQHFPTMEWDDARKEATLSVQADAASIWIAHAPPYPLTRVQKVLADAQRSGRAQLEVIGKSVNGRELHLINITEGQENPASKPCIWITARQHGWETGTSYVLEGVINFLISDDPKAQSLRQRILFRIVPTMDPDGLVDGHVRFNSLGYDLNRHWLEVDPRDEAVRVRMPEIWSVKRAIFAQLDRGQPIDFLLNLHNTETAEYLETQADDDASRAKLRRLSEALRAETSFDSSREPTVSTSPSDTTNSLWTERKVPAVLMEQRIGTSHKLGRRPTVADRTEFGRQLALVLGKAVLGEEDAGTIGRSQDKKK